MVNNRYHCYYLR